MRGLRWLSGLIDRWGRFAGQRYRERDQDELVSYLYVTRLEERRVLNAGAVAANQLVVDAGEAMNDGQTDTFHIEHDGDHIQLSVNDEIVGRMRADKLESLTIKGSLDDDVVTVDFADASLLKGVEILIEGGDGGADVLRLIGDQQYGSVTHRVEEGTSRVTFNGGEESATIIYAGMETVHDELTADARVFQFQDGTQHLMLEDAAGPEDNLSSISSDRSAASEMVEPWSIIFENPTEQLRIDTSAGADDGSDLVDVQSLDDSFTADLFIVGGTDDTLLVSGRTEIGGANVTFSAGQIVIEDTIATHEATVRLTAADEIMLAEDGAVENDHGEVFLESPAVTHNGQISASGGFIGIDSGAEGVTLVRGVIDVSTVEADQLGGTVHILGMEVGLLDEARIDASGAAGGGTILVGGDYQGNNPSIRNATRTFAGSATRLLADGRGEGDGGTVILWADGTTEFYGQISAQGVRGGLAEVSGQDTLTFRGFVDLSGSDGNYGTLLLDPATITIMGGTGDGAADGDDTFAGNPSGIVGTIESADTAPVTVYESELEALNANIVLRATASIVVAGTFDNDNGEGQGVVVLQSGRSLTLEAGSIDLRDDDPLEFVTSLGGMITLTATTGDINVDRLNAGNAGDIKLEAAGDVTGTRITADTLEVNANGQIDLGTTVNSLIADSGTTIEINDTGAIVLTDLESGNGAIVVMAGGAITATDVVANSPVTLVAATGDLTVGTVSAAGDTATLTALAGSIIDDKIDITKVTATTLIMSAANAVGGSGVSENIDTATVAVLTIDANDDIVVDGDNLTNLTDLTLTLDPNGAATYDLTSFNNLTEVLTTDGTNLTITQLDASSAVNLRVTVDTGNVSVTSFKTVGGGTLSLTATGGNIGLAVNSVSTGSGNVSLTAGGAISESAANNMVNITTTSTLTLNAGSGIGSQNAGEDLEISANQLAAMTTSGDVVIDALSPLILGAGGQAVTSSDGDIVITVNGQLVLIGDVATGGTGTIQLTADDIRLATGVEVSSQLGEQILDARTGTLTLEDSTGPDARSRLVTTAAPITIKADDVVIQVNDSTSADQIVAGNNSVTIATNSPSQTISLGSGTGLVLSDAELDQISALLGLEIESTNTSANSIDITAVVDLDISKIPSLHLIAAGGIRDSGGAVLTVASLAMTSASQGIGTAAAPILVDVGNDTLAATATDADIVITESSDVTVGTVTVAGTTVSGLTTIVGGAGTGGSITLTSTGGSITVDQPVNAQGTGQDVILHAGSVAGAHDLTLNATVTAADDAHLRASQDILQAAADDYLVADTLALQAGRAIGGGTVGAAVNAQALDLRVSTVAAESGRSGGVVGNIFLNQDAGGALLVVGQANDLIAGSGTVDGVVVEATSTGAITITTEDDGLTVRQDVTARGSNGTITLTTQDQNTNDNNVAASFTLDATASPTVSTTDGSITITADNMDLQTGAAIVAGSVTGPDNVVLQPFTAETRISIGGADAADATPNNPDTHTLGLSEAELELITTAATSAVVVGSSSNTGGIDVAAAVDLSDAAASTNIVLQTAGDVSDSGAGTLAETTILFQVVGNVGESSADPLNINATNLAGQTTGTSNSSNIFLLEADGVEVNDQSAVGGFNLSGLSSSDGDVWLTVTDGSLTLADGVQIEAGDDGDDREYDVVLVANGAGNNDDIVLNGQVVADDDAHLRASQDILQAAADDYLVADTLALQAGRAIGGGTVGAAVNAQALDLQVSTVAAESGRTAGVVGNISLNQDAVGPLLVVGQANDLIAGSGTVAGVVVNSASTGAITINTEADGLRVDQLVTAVGAAAGDVILHAGTVAGVHDLTLNATVTAGDDAHLRASQDILQAAADDYIVADTLALQAGRAIGGGTVGAAVNAQALDLRVSTVAAESGRTAGVVGNIFLNQDAGGALLVVGQANHLIDGSGTVDGVVVNSASTGAITINTEADGLQVDQVVTAAVGDVILHAGTVAGAHDLTLNATVTAGDEAHLRASQDILQAAADDYLVADTLALQAGRAIGGGTVGAAVNAQALDLRVSTVAAESGRSGGVVGAIFLNQDAGGALLVVGQANDLIAGSGTVAGVVVNSASTGAVTINTEDDSLRVDQLVTAAGAVTGDVILHAGTVAGATDDDLTLNATVTAGDDAHLRASQDILQAAADDYLVADTLALQAGRAIGGGTVGAAVNAQALDLRVSTVAAESGRSGGVVGNIFLNQDAGGALLVVGQANDLIAGSGTVDGVVVEATSTGAITITTEDDGLTVRQDVTARGSNGTITLTTQDQNTNDNNVAASFTLDATASPTVSTTDGSITITADNMDLQTGAAIVAGSVTGPDNVVLQPFTAETRISIGGADAADATPNNPDTHTLGLSEAELELITTATTSAVVVGSSSNTGGIDVAAAVDLSDAAASTNIVLQTAGDVSDSGAGTLAETTILFQVVGNVGESSADPLNINATNLAGQTTGTSNSSNIFLLEADGVEVNDQSAVGGFNLSGLSSSDGDVWLTVTDGSLTLADGVQIEAGDDGDDREYDVVLVANGAGNNDDIVLNGQVVADDDAHLRASQDILQAAADDYLVADTLALQAGRAIGGGTVGAAVNAQALDLQVSTVAAESGRTAGVVGNISLNQDAVGPLLVVGQANDLIAGSGTVAGVVVNSASTGAITINTEADGLRVDQLVTAVGAAAGDVILHAGTVAGVHDLTLNATVTAADEAHLRASRDILQVVADDYIVADTLALQAGRAIGGGTVGAAVNAQALDLRVSTVAAESGRTAGVVGNIFLNQDAGGALLVVGQANHLIDGSGTVDGVVVNSASTGAITINTEADGLQVDQVVTAAVGDVILHAGTVAGAHDLTLNATVTAGDEAHLRASQDILQAAADDYLVADTLALQAGRAIGGGTVGAAVNAQALDLRVSTVAAESGRSGGVVGAIFLNQDAGGALLVVGQANDLIAGSGTVAGVVVNSASTGAVTINTEDDSLRVDQLVTAAGAVTGDVILHAGTVAGATDDDLTLNATVTAGDEAHLRASQDILQAAADDYLVADTLALQAGRAIGGGTVGAAVNAQALDLRVSTVAAESGRSGGVAGNIFLNQDAGGALLVVGQANHLIDGSGTVDGVVVNSASTGAITINTEDDSLRVDQLVTAAGAVTGDVILHAGTVAGATDDDLTLNATVTAGDDAHLRASQDILQAAADDYLVADTLALQAGRAIGGGTVGAAVNAQALDLQVSTVAAESGRSGGVVGDIFLNQDAGGALLVVGQANDLIAGSGTVDGVVVEATSTGAITINTEDDSLRVDQVVTAVGAAAGDVILHAGTVAGASDDDLTLNATVTAGDAAHLRASRDILQAAADDYLVADTLALEAGRAIGGGTVGAAVNAQAIDLRVSTVAARAGGNIFLNQDAGGALLVVGQADDLIAGSGTVDGVVVEATSTGAITINTEADSLRVDQVVTAVGAAAGDVILHAGTVAGATDDDLTLNATVTAGDDAHLRASQDILQAAADDYLVADSLALQAGRAIGGGTVGAAVNAQALDLRVSTVAARAGGNIFLNQDAGGALLVVGQADDLIAGSGTVDGVVVEATSTGAITINTEDDSLRVDQLVTAVGAAAGDVILHAGTVAGASDDDLTLNATVTAGDDAHLRASQDILQAAADDYLVADSLALQAGRAIGGGTVGAAVNAQALDLRVSTVAARAGGNIFLNQDAGGALLVVGQADDLIAGSGTVDGVVVEATSTGAITINTEDDSLRVDQVVTAVGAAAGDVILHAGTVAGASDDDLTLNATVTAGDEAHLRASQDILQAAADDYLVADSLALQAGRAIGGGTVGAAVNAQALDLRVSTVAARAGGNIFLNQDAGGTPLVVGQADDLIAGSGTVDGVVVEATSTGAITINTEDDSLRVDQVVTAVGAAAGDVILHAGTVAGASDDDLTLNATVTAGDDAHLRASQDILQAAADDYLVADSLALLAGRAIGGGTVGAVNAQAIDLRVSTVAAESGRSGGVVGDIFLNQDAGGALLVVSQADDLIAGGGIVTGVVVNSTSTGSITITTDDDSLTVDGLVQARGSLTIDNQVALDANGVDSNVVVNATVTIDGSAINVLADNDVTLGASGLITSTSGNVKVQADADGAGSSGGTDQGALTMANGAIIDAGSGTIELGANEDVSLARLVTTSNVNTEVAVTITSAAGGVVDNGDTGGEDIEANGDAAVVVIKAVKGVGSTDAIDTQVGSLFVVNGTNAASGNVNINETDGVMVQRLLNGVVSDNNASSGAISLTAGGTITIAAAGQGVQATDGNITLNATNANLNIRQNVITSDSGTIVINAGDPNAMDDAVTDSELDLISIGDATILSTDANRQISGIVYSAPDPLSESRNSGDSLTGAIDTAEITVEVTDPQGQNFLIEIDWREGDDAGPPIRQPVVDDTIDGNTPDQFMHEYHENPEPNPTDDINVDVSIKQFAVDSGNAATIELKVNGDSVLLNDRFMTTVMVPVGVFGIGIPSQLPVPEPLPPVFAPPPTVEASFEFTAPEPVEAETAQVTTSSISTTDEFERYYELRTVFFDENGDLDDRKVTINLDVLYGVEEFQLSDLPRLFGRLPDDRYRIYLIEEGADRLVLDFLIRQGRPVETPLEPQSDVLEQQDGAALEPADPVEPQNDAAALPGPADDQSSMTLEESVLPLQAPARHATQPAADEPANESDTSASDDNSDSTFAQRMGSMPFVAHGGTLLTAMTVSLAAGNRWERLIDRVIERIGMDDSTQTGSRASRSADTHP